MTVMVPPHPLVMENLDAFLFFLDVFYVSSLQTLFERVVDNGFTKVIGLLEGIRFLSRKKRM